jgi:hypothetical protein
VEKEGGELAVIPNPKGKQLSYCDEPGPRGNEHLRAVLIIAADTGLRENELFTREKRDVD